MTRSQFIRKSKFAWKIAFLAALALFLLPNLNTGVVKANGESDQNRRIQDIFRNAQVQVRDAQGETIAEVKDGVARQIPDENFESQVKDIGTILRNGQLNLHSAHKNLVYNLQMELSSTPANDTLPNALRGARGNADALANEVFFDIPLEHNKFLLDLGTKIKFRVEYRFLNGGSENGKSKFPTSNAHITMTTNLKLRSKLLYTKGIYDVYGSEYGSPCPMGLIGCNGNGGGREGMNKVRIEMALGGSSTDPSNGEFMGLACIFGKAGPNDMVNVMAFGVAGTFGQTVWADSLGNWRADFGGLGSGHNLFGAVRGLGMPYVMQEGLGGCEYEVCMATNGLTGCDCEPMMMGKAAKIELGLLRDAFRFERR